MEITYRECKDFTIEQMRELFLSVGWLSGRFPARLVKAMAGSSTVISAWAGERLVGLVNVLDDGELTAYAHYLLIHADFHGQGIGQELVRRLKQKYEGYLYLLLVPEDPENVAFYQRYGFEVIEGGTPMQIATIPK